MIDLNTAKFCIWGYLNEDYNTYKHIHEGFLRALQYMGKQVIWLDDKNDLTGVDLSNTIFISEGLRAHNVPLRDDAFYVVHNIDASNSLHHFDGWPLLKWGVRCMRVPLPPGYTQLGAETYLWRDDKPNQFSGYPSAMDFPWATNLLPHEIVANKPNRVFRNDSKVVHWVASGWQGAVQAQKEFARACTESGVKFQRNGHGWTQEVSFAENERLIKESFIAPALASPHQIDVGYIPCRLLKNVSYGQYPVSNSDSVHRLFSGRTIYTPDAYQLFYDARAHLPEVSLAELHAVMDYVAENHTYVNRVNEILAAIRILLESK